LVSLQDFRLTAGSPVAGISATDHQALSNRSAVNAHPAIAIAIDPVNLGGLIPITNIDLQTIIETLDNHSHGYCE
jgi:hypothetical protein